MARKVSGNARPTPNRAPATSEMDELYGSLVNYLVVAAWAMNVDCVVVEAQSLRRYFAVDRLPDDRVELLLHAAKGLFPHQRRLWENPDQRSNVVLHLSRVPLPEAPFRVSVTTSRRVDLLCLGVRAAAVDVPHQGEVRELLFNFRAGRPLRAVRGRLSLVRRTVVG